MTIEVVNVSSRGQIVIPEKIRKNLGIKRGSKLVAIEKNGTLILKREGDLIKMLDNAGKSEEAGWLALAEHSLSKIWDNKKDEKAWGKYLYD